MKFDDHPFDQRLGEALTSAISQFLGSPCRIDHTQPVGGGSISRTVIVQTGGTRWFVKLNGADRHDMFVAEADGLSALGRCSALRVPHVVAHGVCGRQAYLLLEHLNLRALDNDTAGKSAGRALAELHRIEGDSFGWHRDNFIGSTPQLNTRQGTWPQFFARQRLQPQLELAKQNGHKGKFIADGERLLEGLAALFVDYQPVISLLHGDLWHGNAGVDESGRLALFDPAVYYGDRETDLAMSELFGGFPASFHAAYRAAWPLADGSEQRKTLYQLYHVLNHLNLFGSSYRHQCERMIDQLRAEIG
ncbi:fructosamine kinase family protein [Propionivibrio sp.]|uniref:fructosamine kinase family protein n=1 Tax=Propionivibrio sp. TaxID=2212460 RepID=UPI0025D89ECB|nr:fructosamine kinase family protein [Propionivibrio sp.]MBK7356022.1 fructosamine kinase family protein [Propionivibrio sp.]MBK8400311.1 fructosamine kinase family protein [Propionivibrio sp.]MBK8743984.1 fructosamine kinase family protein [Propionivibrio sp.]MBK8892986.1 fructosamine kinase family protein [Propionivibrio sp.]MBL0207327.1 fructosamine kinase family protein [Propionivibrio sp.]